MSLERCRFSNEGGDALPIMGPNRQDSQGYLKPASDYGIDAEYAWTVPGGTGKNVNIADIEYATWNLDHQDLRNTRIIDSVQQGLTPKLDPICGSWNSKRTQVPSLFRAVTEIASSRSSRSWSRGSITSRPRSNSARSEGSTEPSPRSSLAGRRSERPRKLLIRGMPKYVWCDFLERDPKLVRNSL